MNIDKQVILKKEIENIKNNIYKQGYILVSSNDKELKHYSFLLLKSLVCPNNFNENCSSCNICKRIDDNEYPEIKIISPVNDVIKKEDIINLKKNFQKEPVEGKNLVYIIENAELLNVQSANSILKFLEEPEGNLIGIFTTKNYDKIIKTIVSRCQTIKLSSDSINSISDLSKEDLDDILNYVILIETNFSLAIASVKERITDKYNTKHDLKEMLNTILLIYKDLFNYKVKNKFEIFNENSEIKKIADILEIDDIIKKINVILSNIDKINYNVNTSLFMINLLDEIGDVKCKK